MAAANFSRDVLEMFYGPISQEENQRLRAPIRPRRRFDFEIERNNFNNWLRVWKMRVPGGNRDLLKFFQKTKTRFIDVCEHEVRTLKSVKIKFALLVIFYENRDDKVYDMQHYFEQKQPIILNEHTMETLNYMLNQFLDEVKGEIEAWSQRDQVGLLMKSWKHTSTWQSINHCEAEATCHCQKSCKIRKR